MYLILSKQKLNKNVLVDISEPHFFQRGRRKNLMQNGSSGRPFFYQVRIGVGFRYPDWPACYQCQLCAYKAGLHPALRDFQKCENLDSQWNSYGGISRAVHRLCVIGSPREATEKFYAKRVIGSVFFLIGSRRGGLSGATRSPRLMPTPPCGNLNTPRFGSPTRFISVNGVKWTFWGGYNCIKHHPRRHISENLREGLADLKI